VQILSPFAQKDISEILLHEPEQLELLIPTNLTPVVPGPNVNGNPKHGSQTDAVITCFVIELSHFSFVFSNRMQIELEGKSTLAVDPIMGKFTGEEPVNKE